MSEQEIEVIQDLQIVEFDPFRAQLAEMKNENEKSIFDYDSAEGNKAARSHIYKLRKSKTALDKVRKKRKQESLEYGRRVDTQAKLIAEEIDQMIQVHSVPIKAIEDKEAVRVADHQGRIDTLQGWLDGDYGRCSQYDLEDILKTLSGIEPDEKFEEFTASALGIWKQAKAKIDDALVARIKYNDE